MKRKMANAIAVGRAGTGIGVTGSALSAVGAGLLKLCSVLLCTVMILGCADGVDPDGANQNAEPVGVDVAATSSSQLYPAAVEVKRGELLYGFIDSTGKFVIEPKFRDAYVVRYGRELLYTNDNENWWVMRADGQDQLIPFPIHDIQNDVLGSPTDDVLTVRSSHGYSAYTTDGERLFDYPADTQQAHSFFYGMSRFKTPTGYGFVNLRGDVVVEPELDYAFNFVQVDGELIATVEKDGVDACIDDSGSEIRRYSLNLTSTFTESGLATFEKDDLIGYTNLDGEIVIAPQFEEARPFDWGLAAAKRPGNGWQLYDIDGEPVLSEPVDWVSYSSSELGIPVWAYEKDGNWGLVDSKGKTAMLRDEHRIELIPGFFQGDLAFAKCQDGNHGFLDKNGEWVWNSRWAVFYDYDVVRGDEIPRFITRMARDTFGRERFIEVIRARKTSEVAWWGHARVKYADGSTGVLPFAGNE